MTLPAPRTNRRSVLSGPATASPGAQRVLDAALELFGQKGYDGTSLQLIADRLGVTKAAVYYHFRTKDDLLAALVEPAFADLLRLLDDAAAVTRRSARPDEGLRAYINYLVRHRKLVAFLSRDIAALGRPAVRQPARALEARLDQLLTAGEADDTARVWIGAITHALNGALLSAPDATDDWLHEQLNVVGRQLLNGYRSARRRQLATAYPDPAGVA